MRRVGELDILLIRFNCARRPHGELDRQRWAGSKGHLPHRRRGPRSCFCTTRPSTQASYPPTKCGCLTRMRWRHSSNVIRACCWWRRATFIAPPKPSSREFPRPSARPANRRSRLNSTCVGQNFSGSSHPPSTCMLGFQATDLGAWSPMLYRSANFPAPTLMVRRRQPPPGHKRLFSPAIGCSFFGNLQRLYSVCRGNPAMAINGRRNKPIGPGGSTRRLHQSPASDGFRRGRNRIDEGVKGVLLLGMVPPLSGQIHSCKRQLCSGCSGRVSGLKYRSKALTG